MNISEVKVFANGHGYSWGYVKFSLQNSIKGHFKGLNFAACMFSCRR